MTGDRVVVAGGGAVGQWVAAMMRAAGDAVVVTDPDNAAAQLHSDITGPDAPLRDALRAADTVVLAVPAQAALAAIPVLAPDLRDGALLVETLSVKAQAARAVAAAGGRWQALGINPLFSPDLEPRGRPVATVGHRSGPRTEDFLELLGRQGCRVVPVEADAHDRLSAATQALVHAAVLTFGLALSDLAQSDPGLSPELLEAAATPPAATAMALLARIGGGTPEVYWDVQSGNPHGAAVRKLLGAAAARIGSVVDNGTEGDFADLMQQATAGLGERLGDHRATALRLFTVLSGP
ncbi:prephenate dehydrogenase/arogenate dehydrogenase family protein [Speluncibacter jeojiensis]|uniref:Prephenate dehydrogenase/arogenate dehydrogenase family protein n=1 Tax=Speluncibacter jeojiensis TaxID=2710754 RepID=A0A9X4RFL7_9ACTN|nr:prephenate dehydrogenase/arogenate dehydrogenase family protein [Rhodococcus sp. D2-41]MDG3016823.1 prephenate dehydrogenase/arogenate dehydrogenase family protein [Corynebacteriales bacterium D3-21]